VDTPTLAGVYDSGSGSTGVGGSMNGWRTMSLARLGMLSPVIALAMARGDKLAPFVASIKASFADGTVANIPDVSLEGGTSGPLSQAAVIDHVDYQVNQQNAFAGQVGKAQADLFFNLQSPISAKLTVTSSPRYVVAPFYTPLRTLTGMIRRAWPTGWFLNAFDGIQMSFNLDYPLASFPTTVAYTFCMWTPIDSRYAGMRNDHALAELAKCGVNVPICPL
jgi:hypothetical protein